VLYVVKTASVGLSTKHRQKGKRETQLVISKKNTFQQWVMVTETNEQQGQGQTHNVGKKVIQRNVIVHNEFKN
jgi:hypothetical protein